MVKFSNRLWLIEISILLNRGNLLLFPNSWYIQAYNIMTGLIKTVKDLSEC